MQILEWIVANREFAALLLGMAVNVAGLAYNIYKLLRSGRARSLQCWIQIMEAARQYEAEAERHTGLTAAEKLALVLSRLRTYAAELGYPYDEERFTAQVEADIAFTKAVNAEKSEILE